MYRSQTVWCAKLERLNVVHVHLHKIRERLEVVNGNISAFTQMGVNPGFDEYFFYLAEMSIFEELNELIWIPARRNR